MLYIIVVFIKLVSANSTGVNGSIIILEDWSFVRKPSLHHWVKMIGQNTDIILSYNTAIQNNK